MRLLASRLTLQRVVLAVMVLAELVRLATNPTLKGRSADFISKNLTDFRSGARQNPIMNAMSAGLSDADIRNIADYIDSLK